MVSEGQRKRYHKLLKERKEIRKKSVGRIKRNRWISMAIGVVTGLMIAWVMIKADMEGSMDIKDSIILVYAGFAVFLLVYIGHIIIHEAGHLIFGLMTGYRFLSFRIFSTIFYRKDGRIHKKKYSVKGTGGQCLMYPPKRREDGSFPFVLYNLGGCINNLIFSLPFVIPLIVSHNLYLRIFFLILISAGIVTAVMNLIPMNTVIQNDGMNAKSMMKHRYMREAFYFQLELNAQLSDGKRITDYPPQAFSLPEGADDTNTLISFIHSMAYYRQLAAHDFEAARHTLASFEERSENCPIATQNFVNAERLFFMVIDHCSVEEIASVYARSRFLLMSAKTDINIRRIRYVYEAFLTEEEKEDIITLINKKPPREWKEFDREKSYRDFLKAAKNFPVWGEADMNINIADYLKDVLTKRTVSN